MTTFRENVSVEEVTVFIMEEIRKLLKRINDQVMKLLLLWCIRIL